MKYWFLHHMHFLIALDAFLHFAIIFLGILATIYGCKFIRAVKSHPNATKTTTAISYGMLPIMFFIVYCAIHSAAECFVQYGSWWNR